MPFDPRSLNLYPSDPGVYLMKDASDHVLYIGKAKNLAKRLRQYFGATDEREMVPFLMAQVEKIDPIVTLTERDALILENNLIKRHRPKYNVLLKDDKTFISLLITKHKWPMVKLIRSKGKPEGTYFGPYTNALAARHVYDLIQRLFPLRQCSDIELASRKRPCLLYDIKRCIAPCVGKCTREEYDGHVQSAMRLLKGQDKDLVKELKRSMEEASSQLEFEKADAILQTIRQIEHVTSVQHVDNPFAKDCDAIGFVRQADALLITLLQFREGKVIASEHFSFHNIASNDEEALETFLLQHYEKPPPEILLPIELSKPLAELLRTSLFVPQKGKKKDLIEMAEKNAKALFARENDERSLMEKRLLDLQETLHLTRYPRRIECLDSSNIAGTDPVASLASFTHGERDKGRTRFFRIRGKGDDYAALREALLRHLTREKEKGEFCDLLVIDGGKGQLNVVLSVFQELGIASIDAIALAKEEARHDKGLTRERVFLPHQEEPIWINPRSPTLFLLQRIRDEAHRLAINYHRTRRSKRTIQSELEELPGIGPIKMRRILQYFGSVRALKEAGKESLEKVEGLTKKDVERLWTFINKDH